MAPSRVETNAEARRAAEAARRRAEEAAARLRAEAQAKLAEAQRTLQPFRTDELSTGLGTALKTKALGLTQPPAGSTLPPGATVPASELIRSGGATSLLTEDVADGQVNCLDQAYQHLQKLSPEQKLGAELVLLDDVRPGAEGGTGHAVVREGEAVVDPASGTRYPSTEAYLEANPQYREAGTVSATDAERIFSTRPGSPERSRALTEAGVPEGLQTRLVADPARSRPTPEQIEREYTVAPDPGGMKKWPGPPASWVIDQREVTAKEAEMLDRLLDYGDGTHKVLKLRSIAGSADDMAKERFPAQGISNGHGDAFRHAYANALMTKEYGETWTKAFTTAHEGNPESSALAVAMDLHNNEVGRRIALENPDASDEELANLVEQAVNDGEMVVIGQDHTLHYSDELPRDAAAPSNQSLPRGERNPGQEVPTEGPY